MSRYKLFVGHVNADARSKDLERFFRDHGFSKSISEVVVKAGYGFVIFDDRRDADDAIFELNGKEFMNYKLQVEFAKPNGRADDRGGSRRDGGGGGGFRSRDDRGGGRGRSDDRDGGRFSSKYTRPYNTEHRVFINNLSSRCNWQDIKDYFRQAGEVTFAKCHREQVGEGVVEFSSREGMLKALEKLNNTELFGKKLRLSCDASISRSRSRSRSKRRSHSRSRSPLRRASRSPVRRFSRSPSPAAGRRNFSGSPPRRDSRSRSRSPPRRNRGDSTD